MSGEQRGVGATLARGLLAMASWPYAWVVAFRNWLYDRSVNKVEQAGIPVVSIGNVTVGGTGKTPMVEWVCKWLQSNDCQAAIISRGYGSKDGRPNDESMELEHRLDEVPHLQNPDRVEAARAAIRTFSPQVLVLDDAFQHRRIHRDLNIVLIDALRPFGYNHLLPRGLLRESLSGLRRADIVVLSRAESISETDRQIIRREVQHYAPHVPWVEVSHQPSHLLDDVGNVTSLDQLAGRRVAAFCAIGNPLGFRLTLARTGADIADLRDFPDHHQFSDADRQSLAEWVEGLGELDYVLCTHKDLVKLPGVSEIAGCPLKALVVELQVLTGESVLESHLQAMVA